MMIGHCGGLRASQTIGDYVLAHAYLRDDHVLDAVLPADIPIPSIAEVQRALYDATKLVSGAPGEEVKKRLRTGTVVTTDDRNWELRYSKSALRFNQSRAVAIDMEFGHHRGARLSFPRALRDPALRLGQAAARRDQAAGSGQSFSTKARSRSTCRSAFRLWTCCGPRAPGCIPRKLRAFDEPPFR